MPFAVQTPRSTSADLLAEDVADKDSKRDGDYASQTAQLAALPTPAAGPDQTYFAELRAAFAAIAEGRMADARSQAHSVADRWRQAKQQDSGPVTEVAGQIWRTSHALSLVQSAIGSKDYENAKTRASEAAGLARTLKATGRVDPALADSVVKSAGGWWTLAETSIDVAKSKGGGGAMNTPLIDQHALPHWNAGNFCGLATLGMVFEYHGNKVDMSSAAAIDSFKRGIYIPGDGSSGAGMAARMREKGLKGAQFGTGGKASALNKMLAEGKPVPVGVMELEGVIEHIPNTSERYGARLKKGDRHYKTFPGSGHWVAAVGIEGSPEAPTHYYINDPDTGARLKLTVEQFSRAARDWEGIWMISY